MRFGLVTVASVRKLAAVMAAAGVSRGAQLVAAMSIARAFGPTDYGLFVFTIGTALIASAIGGLGWQMSYNRLMPRFVAQAQFARAKGLLRMADRVTVAGCAVGAAVLVAAGLVARDLGSGFLFAALLTIPLGITQLRRQQLAGAGRAPLSLLIDQGFASIVVAIAAVVATLTLAEIVLLYLAGLIVANTAATIVVRRDVHPDVRDAAPSYDTLTWARMSWSMLIAQLARLLLSRLDVLLIPTLSTLTEAGLYGAALRITFVLTFPQMILQTLIGPMLGNAFAVDHHVHARRLLLYSVGFALATSLPFALAICVDPALVLRVLFGAPYAAAATTLVLITFGQLGVSVAIPLGAALMMGGRERALWRINVAILGLSVALAFVLIPRYGALGAGIVGLVSGLGLSASHLWLCIPLLRGGERAAMAAPRSDGDWNGASGK